MKDLLSSRSFASGEKPIEDAARTKHGQSTVTSTYQAKVAGLSRSVVVVWAKNLMHHYINLTIENPYSDHHYTCKIDLKPWHFWNKKGYKSFEVDGKRVDVFWDLRMAKFASGSEPVSDYYVAIVSDEEVALLLGDCKKEAFKKTKSRPGLTEATLISKKENIFGKRNFTTRAKFDESSKEHQIIIENSISVSTEPEMLIIIDGTVLIRVNNLHWKFRGNRTVTVNQVPLQVFWDVHSWLFSSPGTGHALFIFKRGQLQNTIDNDKEDGANDDEEADSGDGLTPSHAVEPEFSLFLYAWMLE